MNEINLNEVRIGILVNSNGVDFSVSKGVLELWLKDYITLYPVLLTEELMVKSGFYQVCQTFTKDNLIIEFGWYEQIAVFIKSDFYRNIEYYHQLQNLTLDLTGEQLTYKP